MPHAQDRPDYSATPQKCSSNTHRDPVRSQLTRATLSGNFPSVDAPPALRADCKELGSVLAQGSLIGRDPLIRYLKAGLAKWWRGLRVHVRTIFCPWDQRGLARVGPEFPDERLPLFKVSPYALLESAYHAKPCFQGFSECRAGPGRRWRTVGPS